MASAEESIASQLEGVDSANLYPFIQKSNVHGLNLTVPEDAQAVIKPWIERNDNSKYAESGVDDQNVRVKSMLLKLGRGEQMPRHLRIYANNTNIVDFSEAEELKPELNISLLEGETGVTEYPLRSAAFANIYSLSLFFSEAVGGESLVIYYIGFRGDSRSQRRDVSQMLEIPAANAADSSLVDRLAQKQGAQQPTAR
ncbi:DUF1000-domain-containing protein [Wolfiporia cocos MD-104 SS10]|uniref:DUF1000-domain-containing protein n=1 Tax=Wolfiporia cocos (strain MD-104) TaxID=742152 RepID=A0A2H3JCE2_WOLCO|nr:DUF1000-domain-containing protein [Wolfiporia cocos MD-104 SS10]